MHVYTHHRQAEIAHWCHEPTFRSTCTVCNDCFSARCTPRARISWSPGSTAPSFTTSEPDPISWRAHLEVGTCRWSVLNRNPEPDNRYPACHESQRNQKTSKLSASTIAPGRGGWTLNNPNLNLNLNPNPNLNLNLNLKPRT